MKRIKRNRHQIVCENLTRIMDLRQKPTTSRKYKAFDGGKKYPGLVFFVGRSGALKVGKNISNAISYTDRIDYAEWRKDLDILDELSTAKEIDNIAKTSAGFLFSNR